MRSAASMESTQQVQATFPRGSHLQGGERGDHGGGARLQSPHAEVQRRQVLQPLQRAQLLLHALSIILQSNYDIVYLRGAWVSQLLAASRSGFERC
jgi:hypothetical protein